MGRSPKLREFYAVPPEKGLFSRPYPLLTGCFGNSLNWMLTIRRAATKKAARQKCLAA
jgi:hypothetical protein